MRYWDASALVPLIVAEEASGLVSDWLAENPSIVTWLWTQVELVGAVERRARHGQITPRQRPELIAQ